MRQSEFVVELVFALWLAMWRLKTDQVSENSSEGLHHVHFLARSPGFETLFAIARPHVETDCLIEKHVRLTDWALTWRGLRMEGRWCRRGCACPSWTEPPRWWRCCSCAQTDDTCRLWAEKQQKTAHASDKSLQNNCCFSCMREGDEMVWRRDGQLLLHLYVLSPREERYSMKISSDTSVSPSSTTVSGGPSIVPPWQTHRRQKENVSQYVHMCNVSYWKQSLVFPIVTVSEEVGRNSVTRKVQKSEDELNFVLKGRFVSF